MEENKMLIFDAHLDLSMNAMEWNRDMRLSVQEIREREKGKSDKPDRGKGTVSLPAMKAGNIGLCVATQIARYVKEDNYLPGWHSPEQAWAQTQGQLAWYKAMENEGLMNQITNRQQLLNHIEKMNGDVGDHPIGYVLSLEGADSMVDLSYVEKAYVLGLRAIGPAHYGPGTYAQGTNADGGIGEKGRALLKEMDNLNMILDVTHLCDESFWEALEHFHGPVWASHNNCRALAPDHRQFSDDQIKALIERNAVIGGVLDAWMMIHSWQRGVTDPKLVNLTLETLINHMDHICQLAGNANHIGIGSDLDGGFGKEQCPHDLETIADLQKYPQLLASRGYDQEDIKKVMHQNWIDFLLRNWQEL